MSGDDSSRSPNRSRSGGNRSGGDRPGGGRPRHAGRPGQGSGAPGRGRRPDGPSDGYPRGRGRAQTDAANLDVKLDTWQFVRVMVALEPRRHTSALWRRWKDTWTELDRELADLAKVDFDAYSELMMQHRLTLASVSQQELQELSLTIDTVIRDISRSLSKTTDPSAREDLEYERSELRETNGSLAKRLPSARR